MEENEKVTYFAETDHRNRKTKFGIKAKDRTKHMYVIGKTGMGKSTLLENMAIQDIQNGNGIAFIDPHGATAEKLLDYIPEHRVDDVLYFAPFDVEYPVSFNVMEDVGEDKRHLVLDGLMSAFKKIWVDAWSARMEYILGNTILALLEYPDSTMLGINRMYTDKEYREKVVSYVKDPLVKAFWNQEFAGYTDRYAQEATPAIQNKVGQFTANPLIRNIIGQSISSFDVRKMMDEKKIIIINLSKGRVGEQNANLLGSMLITKIYLAAMSRADLPSEKLNALPNFYLYVDEFQSFANESFANILSEARKYKLNLTVAHQYIEQMSEEVRAAVFGNVGTMVSFRVGSYDAEVLEKEFAPQFTSEDMVNLGFAQIYLKLMVDGISSAPFSAVTLPPIEEPQISYHDVAKARSRGQYATPRADVESKIRAEQEVALQAASRKTESKNKKPYSDQRRPQTSQSSVPSFERRRDTRLNNEKASFQKPREEEKVKVGGEDHLKSLRDVLQEAVGKGRAETANVSPEKTSEVKREKTEETQRGEKAKEAEHSPRQVHTSREHPPEISKKKLRDLLHVEKEDN
ncbi:MAG: type IV secretory system conjugative DNA transfer family protein [Candidatus Paceibacterota bacterium]